MKPSILITNPLSGKYKRSRVFSLIKKLKNSGLKIEEIELKKDQEIKEIIDNLNPEDYDTLFLTFGDGTINSAINAIANRDDISKFKLCIVPFGTANVLASEVKTNTIKKVVKAVKNNKTKKLYLGKVIKIDGSSRYFSVLVSAGFDSLTVSMVTDDIKNKFGKFAYIQKLLKIIKKRRFIDLKTKVNNKKYKNILTCVSNGKYYGGKIHLTDSELDDNNFDIIIIKKFDPISMINYMITRNNNKNIIKLKTKNVEINSEHTNYPVQIDGDYYNNLPIKIETTDKFINVICL